MAYPSSSTLIVIKAGRSGSKIIQRDFRRCSRNQWDGLMRKMIAFAALVAMGLTAGAAMAQDKQALMAEGKALMQEIGGALKSELQAAIEEGGPVKAIEVCNLRAPEIAAAVSQDTGWTISRSSHKLRNPKNAPDAYTTAAIEEFLARQNAGEAAADLAKAEIVEAEGGKVFRMVKAIPTGELCLNCHGGTEVKAEVVEALAELYPEDQARGFKVGEMRGVFTLQKPLN
jgi:hypothetical protein